MAERCAPVTFQPQSPKLTRYFEQLKGVAGSPSTLEVCDFTIAAGLSADQLQELLAADEQEIASVLSSLFYPDKFDQRAINAARDRLDDAYEVYTDSDTFEEIEDFRKENKTVAEQYSEKILEAPSKKIDAALAAAKKKIKEAGEATSKDITPEAAEKEIEALQKEYSKWCDAALKALAKAVKDGKISQFDSASLEMELKFKVGNNSVDQVRVAGFANVDNLRNQGELHVESVRLEGNYSVGRTQILGKVSALLDAIYFAKVNKAEVNKIVIEYLGVDCAKALADAKKITEKLVTPKYSVAYDSIAETLNTCLATALPKLDGVIEARLEKLEPMRKPLLDAWAKEALPILDEFYPLIADYEKRYLALIEKFKGAQSGINGGAVEATRKTLEAKKEKIRALFARNGINLAE